MNPRVGWSTHRYNADTDRCICRGEIVWAHGREMCWNAAEEADKHAKGSAERKAIVAQFKRPKRTRRVPVFYD